MNLNDLKAKIPDLSKIDIKDIDINKIKEELLDRKELVIQVGIGVVAFFMIVSMVSGSGKEVKQLKAKIKSMQAKSDIIAQYKKSQAEIDEFLKSLPPSFTEDEIITLVTDLADKNKVKISTFTPNSPGEEDGKKSYLKTSIQFSLQAGDYKDVVRLISDIENSKLHIKSCNIQGINGGPEEGTSLNFRVEVASLEVKK
jgi:Tfp pilus assembly protein PilO